MKKYWKFLLFTLFANDALSKNIIYERVDILKDKYTCSPPVESFGSFQNPPIKLIKATRQKWSAGIKKGGSGLEYSFYFIMTSPGNILFDTVWINKKAFKTFVPEKKGSKSGRPVRYISGDTVVVRATEYINNNQSSAVINPPLKYSGSALVRYSFNSKRMYFTIKEISNISSVYQP